LSVAEQPARSDLRIRVERIPCSLDGGGRRPIVWDNLVIGVEAPVKYCADSAPTDFTREFGRHDPRGATNRFGYADEFRATDGKKTVIAHQVVCYRELFVSGCDAQHTIVDNVPNKSATVVVKWCSAFGADCHWLRLRPTTEGFYDTALNEANDA